MSDFGLVTVLMSVYKTEMVLLKRSVKSILNQTYSNIEFLIIDDGADEDCIKYLESISDARLHLVHNEKNIGLAASLNKGIELSNGKYIARMDADDYSLPKRIFEQAKYMDNNSEVDVLSCISLDIKDGKLTGGIGGAYLNFDNEDMKIELSLAPKTFPHPTVMFRTSFLMKTGIRYDEAFLRAQDYDMWARCSMVGTLDSLQKPLLLYELGEKTSGVSDLQVYYSNLTKLKCLKRLLPEATDSEKELYIKFRETKLSDGVDANLQLISKLLNANRKKGIYDQQKYKEIVYFWMGRKMLYPENSKYLLEFFKNPKFLLNVIGGYVYRLHGHLLQVRYRKKVVANATKNNGQILCEGIVANEE